MIRGCPPSHLAQKSWSHNDLNRLRAPRCEIAVLRFRKLSPPNRNVLILGRYQARTAARFPSIPIIQNGARRQGFASPRNKRATLTAPRRSEHLLRRGKGEVCKSGHRGHFYLAGLGHFHLAMTLESDSLQFDNQFVTLLFSPAVMWRTMPRHLGRRRA